MRQASPLLTLGSPFRSPLFFVVALALVTLAYCADDGGGAGLMVGAATVGVISATRAAERWARRSANASGDYTDGVNMTPRSWAAASTAAAASYKAGVQTAATAGRYEKGIQKAGDAKWKRKASAVGPTRYAEGVGAAQGDYGTAVGPVLDVIGRVDLPPRGPVGSAGNLARVAVIANALHALRTK
jgi:hypothetical protein